MTEERNSVRFSDIEKDIGVIQKENEIQTRVYVKFEVAIEKLQDLTESMHRLISIHDERINVQTRNIENIRDDVDQKMKELENRLVKKMSDTEERILDKIAELKQDNNDDKADKESSPIMKKVDSYKWFIMGALFVIGITIGKTGAISNIFQMLTLIK